VLILCSCGLHSRRGQVGIARAAEGFSIFDIFAPTPCTEDEHDDEDEYDWGLRTIERKDKRAIEYQIFLEVSSSYLVFVLQS
jgi:hypothetical protein